MGYGPKKWPSCDNRWVELTKNSCPKLLERSDAYCASLAITWGDMFLVLTSPNSEELLTGQRQNLVVATTPSSERQVFSGVPSAFHHKKKSGPSAVKQEVSFPVPVADCRVNHCAICITALRPVPSNQNVDLLGLQSSAHVPPKFGVPKHRMTCPS